MYVVQSYQVVSVLCGVNSGLKRWWGGGGSDLIFQVVLLETPESQFSIEKRPCTKHTHSFIMCRLLLKAWYGLEAQTSFLPHLRECDD